MHRGGRGCCTYCCLVLINKSTFVHQSTGSRRDIYKPAGTVRCLDRRIARSRQVLASRRQLQRRRRRRRRRRSHIPSSSAFTDRPAGPCNYLHSHRRLDFPLPYRPTPPPGRYLVMQFTYRADGVSVWSRICCWCLQRDPASETETQIETSLAYTVRRSYCVKFRLASLLHHSRSAPQLHGDIEGWYWLNTVMTGILDDTSMIIIIIIIITKWQ